MKRVVSMVQRARSEVALAGDDVHVGKPGAGPSGCAVVLAVADERPFSAGGIAAAAADERVELLAMLNWPPPTKAFELRLDLGLDDEARMREPNAAWRRGSQLGARPNRGAIAFLPPVVVRGRGPS
jgi:hypothetical protein